MSYQRFQVGELAVSLKYGFVSSNLGAAFGVSNGLERAAVVLAGGSSNRLGQDKGLVALAGKPLVKHVLDAVSRLAEEKIIVLSSDEQANRYCRALKGEDAAFLVDRGEVRCPLVGAVTGFQSARSKYSLLLPCDVPLISRQVVSLLFDLSCEKSAVIPRWPDCKVEPLEAVYRTDSALDAAKIALRGDECTMQVMIDNLARVRFVSTLVIQQLDPWLNTFLNVNTPLDLKRAERIIKQGRGDV